MKFVCGFVAANTGVKARSCSIKSFVSRPGVRRRRGVFREKQIASSSDWYRSWLEFHDGGHLGHPARGDRGYSLDTGKRNTHLINFLCKTTIAYLSELIGNFLRGVSNLKIGEESDRRVHPSVDRTGVASHRFVATVSIVSTRMNSHE